MKILVLKISLFISLIMLSFLGLICLPNGYTDPFHLKVSSPKQSSLILGSSRAAQGIVPSVINKKLKGELKIFNFAFTISNSPFGPVYYNRICNKIDENTENGLFIVEVNPWTISSKLEDPNDTTKFRELKGVLGKCYFVDLRPNIFYWLSSFKGKYINILEKRVTGDKNHFLYDDGWLEITVPMDSINIAMRSHSKLKSYTENVLPFYQFSEMRLLYLKKTLSFLKQYGRAFIVRVPISEEMLSLEQEFMPSFNEKINSISSELNIDYFDFTGRHKLYKWTDGNHLYKESSKQFSGQLIDFIRNNTNQLNEEPQ